MTHQGVRKAVLILVGLLFLAAAIPLVMFFSKNPTVAMLMSIYVTLGVFLLLSAGDPMAHRSLISFAGWANLAHAAVMTVQAYRHVIESREMLGVALFAIVGVALIAITPAKEAARQTSAARAA